MITLRASTVDSFRTYADPDNDFISTEEMDARLLGEGSTNPAMELGTAFHAAVAGNYVGAVQFDPDSIYRARLGLGDAVPEVEGSVVLDIDGTPALLTGHADWLCGLDMLEIKTSTKPIPPERYADSMQWRCYCVIFGIERVTYRLVQLDETGGDYFAKVIDDVTLYRYPKLHDDVVRCLRSLLGYVRARGLVLPSVEGPDKPKGNGAKTKERRT